MKKLFLILLNVSLVIKAQYAEKILSEPNFELYNKDAKPVFFTISNKKNQTESLPEPVLSTKYSRKHINVGQTLYLDIFADNQLYKRAERVHPLKSFVIKPNGKTVYVSWNNNRLYPQTGPLSGLIGTTKSGLPLKYNIKQGAIEAKSDEAEFKVELE